MRGTHVLLGRLSHQLQRQQDVYLSTEKLFLQTNAQRQLPPGSLYKETCVNALIRYVGKSDPNYKFTREKMRQ